MDPDPIIHLVVVVPLLIGQGLPLFPRDDLRRADNDTYADGTVKLCYAVER